MLTAEKQPFVMLCVLAALEKLGFNGIRALLVIYVTRELRFSDRSAFDLYAALMSLGYLTPLIGGYMADRHLGDRWVIIFGACFASAGMGTLMMSSSVGFHVALSLLLLGGGLMKAGIPAAVGRLPGVNSTDARYAILYAAFNAGTLFGVFGCAAVGETLGWHFAFAIAGSAFVVAIPLAWLLPADMYCRAPTLNMLLLLLIVPLFGLALQHREILHFLFGLASLVFLPTLMYIGYHQGRLKATASLVVLMAAHAVCFALMEQVALSLMLFIERNVDRRWGSLIPLLGDVNIPVMFFQGLDPVMNVFMGGLFAWMWMQLQSRKNSPSVWFKFGLGLLVVAAAFAVLACGCSATMSPWLIALVISLVVVAEQLTVPIGFTAVKDLSPPGFAGFYIGCWFFSISLSELLANRLARLTVPDQAMTTFPQARDYASAFNIYAWIGFVAGVALLAIAATNRRLLRIDVTSPVLLVLNNGESNGGLTVQIRDSSNSDNSSV